MPRQSFYFLTESAVRLEFHVTAGAEGLSLETLHNPPREPDTATFSSADEAADAIAARVKFHLSEHHAVLRLIRWRHDMEPITLQHLGRYGVPVVPVE